MFVIIELTYELILASELHFQLVETGGKPWLF